MILWSRIQLATQVLSRTKIAFKIHATRLTKSKVIMKFLNQKLTVVTNATFVKKFSKLLKRKINIIEITRQRCSVIIATGSYLVSTLLQITFEFIKERSRINVYLKDVLKHMHQVRHYSSIQRYIMDTWVRIRNKNFNKLSSIIYALFMDFIITVI